MSRADLDALLPLFMLCDLRKLPASPKEGYLPPPQIPDEVSGTGSVDKPPFGHSFTAGLGHWMEMWEMVVSKAPLLKQTSHLQKMEIGEINEPDYCQLLKGT